MFNKKKAKQKIKENFEAEGQAQHNPKLSVETKRLIAEGRKFEQARSDSNLVKAKFAMYVALSMMFVAVLESIALIVLMPLKTVQPYVIQVEKSSGYTQVARPLATEALADEALSRFFVNRYVLARETYDWHEVQTDFDVVREMSSADVFSAYKGLMYSKDGPLNRFGENLRAVATVSGISFLNDHTAQVRLTIEVKNNAGEVANGYGVRNWIATVSFDYPNGHMSDDQRLINPLDFRVTAYRLDPEVGQ